MDWRFDRENDDVYLSVRAARIVETNSEEIFEDNLGKTIDESGFFKIKNAKTCTGARSIMIV